MSTRITIASTIALLTACSAAAPQPTAATDAKPSAEQSEQKVASDEKPTAQIAESPDEEEQLAKNPDEPDGDDSQWGIRGEPSYPKVVSKVAGMVSDASVRRMAQRRKLNVLNVAWEDTGRSQGSSLGPNISDMTLQVRFEQDGRERTALMPVIRFPNFTDKTGDVPADKFFIRVGNHRGAKLKTVSLKQVLGNLRRHVTRPWEIKGSGNLLAKRDSHFLVSAQAVFLPIPKSGKAEFNPVVFNYQSAPKSPAVLTILVTRQGTSVTVIENKPMDRTAAGWGQELYFNNKGKRAAFTAERKSDVKKRIAAQGGPKSEDDKSALQKGADTIFLIQVPLKHKQRGYLGGLAEGAMEDGMAFGSGAGVGSAAPAPSMKRRSGRPKSDVEQAVIGHGKNRGKFVEGAGLKLERDPRFPIRITVQFYKATSNGVVNEQNMDEIAQSIGSVYEHADFVGSLVLPQGDPKRPTEWQTIPGEWFPW